MKSCKPLLAAALLAPSLALAQQPVMYPQFGSAVAGDMVSVRISGWNWPTYAPATRYARNGSTFTIDMEYASDYFGPSRGDFQDLPVPLGELPPGAYTINLRLADIARPNSPLETFTTFVNVGTQAHGVKSIPATPTAQANFQFILSTPYYFDPASVRVSREGAGLRVDYRYDPAAPVSEGTRPPAGMVAWTQVNAEGLPAGKYSVTSMGTPIAGGYYYLSFQELRVRTSVDAIEFYSEADDRYFSTASGTEIAMLDDANSGWKRTGQRFSVWQAQSVATDGAQPVCRFHAPTLGSYYHTANPAECQWLRELEAQERARGGTFQGWAYEGIAFYALLPVNGECPVETIAVNRARRDQDRRLAVNPQVYASMAYSWAAEGIAFCADR